MLTLEDAQRGHRLFIEREAAEISRLHPNTLRKLRMVGGGPQYLQIGRAVRYPSADLVAWLDSRRRASTAGTAA